MTAADKFRGIRAALSAARSIPTILGIYTTRVFVVYRQWQGGRRSADGGFIDYAIYQGQVTAQQTGGPGTVMNTGLEILPRPHCRFLSSREIWSSGGVYNDGDVRVEGITPWWTGPDGVQYGYTVQDVAPDLPVQDGIETFYRLVGAINGEFVRKDSRYEPFDEYVLILSQRRTTPTKGRGDQPMPTLPMIVPIQIQSVTPNTGSSLGGTAVTVVCAGFVDGGTVAIVQGNISTLVTYAATPTGFTLTMPPGSVGAADIVLTNPSGLSQRFASEFTYTPPVPSNFGTVQWWLRADLGTTLNAVSQWTDARGSSVGPTFAQTGAATAQPTYSAANARLNNQPSINLSHTTAQFLTQVAALANPPSQPYWMISVAYDTDFTRQQGWIADSQASPDVWYQSSIWDSNINTPPNYFGASNGTALSFATVQIPDIGQSVIFMSEFNDPYLSTVRINSDTPAYMVSDTGVSTGKGPPATNSSSPNPLGQIGIGHSSLSANTMNGSIGFVIVGHGTLTDAQRQSIELYLSQRFNIAVSGIPAGTVAQYPTQIDGVNIDILLDPAVTSSITASVSAWADQSGAGDAHRNVAQATLTSQPYWNPSNPAGNGAPSLHFTTSPNTFLTMAGLWSNAPVTQPYTMIVVGSDAAAGTEIFLGQSGANNWYVTATGGHYGASVGATLLGTTPDSTSLKILMIEATDPSSTIRVSELTAEATGNAIFGNLPQLEIAGANGGSGPLLGDIFEIIIFQGLLSAANRAAILQKYLGPRYGISIGS